MFEAITELRTYYLTRVEWALLRTNAAEIARSLDADQIVELGSGSAPARATTAAVASTILDQP